MSDRRLSIEEAAQEIYDRHKNPSSLEYLTWRDACEIVRTAVDTAVAAKTAECEQLQAEAAAMRLGLQHLLLEIKDAGCTVDYFVYIIESALSIGGSAGQALLERLRLAEAVCEKIPICADILPKPILGPVYQAWQQARSNSPEKPDSSMADSNNLELIHAIEEEEKAYENAWNRVVEAAIALVATDIHDGDKQWALIKAVEALQVLEGNGDE